MTDKKWAEAMRGELRELTELHRLMGKRLDLIDMWLLELIDNEPMTFLELDTPGSPEEVK